MGQGDYFLAVVLEDLDLPCEGSCLQAACLPSAMLALSDGGSTQTG